jgi:hypothetical protein
MLSFGVVLRGALARFLPASLVSIAAFFVVWIGVPLNQLAAKPTVWLWAPMAAALTAGYLAGLEVSRRLLPPVKAIDGRRSLMAGLVSPLPLTTVWSLGSPFNPPWGYYQALGWVSIGGVALAVITYSLRWPSPRKAAKESESDDRTATRPEHTPE